MKEVSSGGVVFFGNTILLLMKMNGDWVLPKGRIEEGETQEEAALREVLEETSVRANTIEYIDEINYTFQNFWSDNNRIDKKVHWFLMTSKSMKCHPQKEEGFRDAKFVYMYKAKDILKYDDERGIVIKAIKRYEEINR